MIADYRSNIHVGGFVSALAICDKATEEHTQRVTVGVSKLARIMGIPDEELIHIRRGALLHDIGKILIPNPAPARMMLSAIVRFLRNHLALVDITMTYIAPRPRDNSTP